MIKDKISFKMWLTVFFGGIWQFIRNIFSWKNKTPFWRVIWAVITCCILFFTCIVGYTWYQEEYRWPLRYCDKQRIAPQIDFVRPTDNRWSGWTQNVQTGEIITKDIDWVAISADEDSLIVYASKGKRGYINRYSGEVSIPAKYKKAWVFSSGVAGVIEKDSVFFIDHKGKPVNVRKFKFNPKTNGYVYHGDYCAIADESGKMGLIDKSGNWTVMPEYDQIVAEAYDFWRMRKGVGDSALWYAFNNKAEQVTDQGYPAIEIIEDYGVIATLPNHLLVAFGFDGQKSSAFFMYSFESMYYNTETCDENGENIYAPTTLMRYCMPDGHEGLCTIDGELITEPLYWEVRPLNKDLYICTISRKKNVLINSKGETIKQTEL